jgi:hypothetical protein
VIPLATDPPAHCVHQGCRVGEIHGIVYHGRRRNAIEVQQLEERDPKDVEDLFVEAIQRAACIDADDSIEGSLPAKRARRDFVRQRAIAFVSQVRTHACERGW